jgi:hypothetical protein
MRPLDQGKFERAVMGLALCKAKWAVRAQILAKGQKVCHFSCVELNARRDQYFSVNREELIAQALVDVWRLPSMAKYKPQPGSQPPNNQS